MKQLIRFEELQVVRYNFEGAQRMESRREKLERRQGPDQDMTRSLF